MTTGSMTSDASATDAAARVTGHVAGLDEAGRGCLAGPVYAAAVILPPGLELPGLNDSKQLSASRREALFERIQQHALAWSIAQASVEEIFSLNILHASMLAMTRAAQALATVPDLCLIDGNRAPRELPAPARCIVGGDALEPSIMAASILAKVARDAEMARLDAEYPGYGFARHKGYGTARHLQALRELGPTVVHRMGFAPCAQISLDFATEAT